MHVQLRYTTWRQLFATSITIWGLLVVSVISTIPTSRTAANAAPTVLGPMNVEAERITQNGYNRLPFFFTTSICVWLKMIKWKKKALQSIVDWPLKMTNILVPKNRLSTADNVALVTRPGPVGPQWVNNATGNLRPGRSPVQNAKRYTQTISERVNHHKSSSWELFFPPILWINKRWLKEIGQFGIQNGDRGIWGVRRS